MIYHRTTKVRNLLRSDNLKAHYYVYVNFCIFHDPVDRRSVDSSSFVDIIRIVTIMLTVNRISEVEVILWCFIVNVSDYLIMELNLSY